LLLFLRFQVSNEPEHWDQACKHMTTTPGYLEQVVEAFRRYGERQKLKAKTVHRILREALFGDAGGEDQDDDEGDVAGTPAAAGGEEGSGPLAPASAAGSSSLSGDSVSSGTVYSSTTGGSSDAGSSPQRGAGKGGSGSGGSSKKGSRSSRRSRLTRSTSSGSSLSTPKPFSEHPRFERVDDAIYDSLLPVFQRLIRATRDPAELMPPPPDEEEAAPPFGFRPAAGGLVTPMPSHESLALPLTTLLEESDAEDEGSQESEGRAGRSGGPEGAQGEGEEEEEALEAKADDVSNVVVGQDVEAAPPE
jgi:hypothetical protein